MHCETAPCEPVCPVEASVHDHEGLNVQVYNRCIGTRFCQSNCPYKVRRFNWFGYADGQEYRNLGDPIVKAANNPDVSVRARGVMEKCTYCVQRISRARRLAERETRLIREGEVVTACQAACPTRAIHFGNLIDPDSTVSKLRREPRHYVLLGDLGTRPRTTYLAKLRNSNPELRGGRMTVASAFDRAPALEERPILPRTINDRTITDLVCAPLMRPAGRRWWIAFLICSVGTLATIYGVYTLFTEGIGVFGNNTSVVWGFPIANYVWWIGLGNAGTLISSLLVLTRQSWRATVSRFAEAMTLFAVSIAGLFPIFHLGRPLYFYWLAPYPDTMRRLAAMAQRARLGLLGDHQLSDFLDRLLVRRRPSRFRDGARPLEWRMAEDLRSRGAWLARLGQTLAPLPSLADHARGVGDAARLLGPFHRRPRFRREPDARMARADFPALFRRRRHVFGLRAGCPARRDHHARPRTSRSHHHAPLRSHGQDHADGVDRDGPVLSQRIFRRMVRRQSGRPRPRQVRIHRRLLETLCSHALLQRGRAADSVVAADAREVSPRSSACRWPSSSECGSNASSSSGTRCRTAFCRRWTASSSRPFGTGCSCSVRCSFSRGCSCFSADSFRSCRCSKRESFVTARLRHERARRAASDRRVRQSRHAHSRHAARPRRGLPSGRCAYALPGRRARRNPRP